ncbi:MAG TPA: hypothetical protein VK425_04445, partial [Acidimicrobiales bacterium]|nr:hypothetical protein [Acidimicrobiales bacterium]
MKLPGSGPGRLLLPAVVLAVMAIVGVFLVSGELGPVGHSTTTVGRKTVPVSTQVRTAGLSATT